MEALLGFDLDFWDYVTFASMSVIVLGGLGAAVFILGLPGRIAIAREHPEAEAVYLMQNTFGNESFLDEIAAATGVDPFEMRVRHLKDPRGLEVLERLRKL